MIPPGKYHLLIHAVKQGVWVKFIHATCLPDGERVVLPVFDNQMPKLRLAVIDQPKALRSQHLAGAQVYAIVALDKQGHNKITKFAEVKAADVKTDVDMTTPPEYCDF